MWDVKIDDVIAEVEAEIEERTTAHRLAIERFNEDHEKEMRPLYDALEHLRQARVGALAGLKTLSAAHLINQSSGVTKGAKSTVPGRNAALKPGANKSPKFPVKREVRKLVRILDGEYSPQKVEDILDKKFPGVADQINHSSVHRALQDLVKAGEVIKLGVGRYKNKD